MAILDRVQLLARTPSPAPDPRTPATEQADTSFAAVADCLNRGLLLARRGEHTAALAVYGKALALAPQQGEIYLCRGMAHFACGALNDAIADFNMALYYAPGLSSALAERGRASLTLGNARAAVIDCTAALCVNPRNLHAYGVRATCTPMGSARRRTPPPATRPVPPPITRHTCGWPACLSRSRRRSISPRRPFSPHFGPTAPLTSGPRFATIGSITQGAQGGYASWRAGASGRIH